MSGQTPFNFKDILDSLQNLGSEYKELGSVSYAAGLATMTATGSIPFFRILTPSVPEEIIDSFITRYGVHSPVDGATYSLLSFRMWSSQDSSYSVRWDKTSNGSSALTTLQDVHAGWNTYQVNLNTATIGSGEPTWSNGTNKGLGIFPLRNSIGAQVKFDWIQLTPSSTSCSTFNTTYSSDAGSLVSFFIDDNTDPTDGYVERTEPSVASGSSTSISNNTSRFFPGSYNVIGMNYDDFYTQNLAPVDMASSTDIVSSSIVEISGSSFTAGKFCGTTTGTDPSFRISQPGANATIDSSVFRYLTFNIEGLSFNNTMQVIFFDENLSPIGARNKYFTVNGVYTFDMHDLSLGGSGNWSGNIGAIRIDPGIRNNEAFCVDWVRLGHSAVTTAPVTPTLIVSPGTISINQRDSAYFKMPDIEGGRDYYTHVKGNPVNFSSSSDWSFLVSQQEATLYPGNQYLDNKGDAYNGDYFEAKNLQSGGTADGDTHVFLSLRQLTNPINASLYKRACVTLAIPDVDIDADHTVLRFGWEHPNFDAYTSDDIVLRTNGRGRYCTDLSVAAIEEGGVSKNGDYWSNPAQSNNVISFRVDGHERDDSTTLILDDLRLAADHEAGDQFAIVVGGDRTSSVSVYKNTSNSTTGGTLIGTLNANRSSDVLLWDTSSETTGVTYYLYATVNARSFLSRAPVVINSSYSDTSAPILSVDAPAADGSGRYATLDLAGYALDGIRIATIEAQIDGTLVESFLPEDFRIAARNLYPDKPYASNSGFQKSISLSDFSDGAHTLTLTAYDTAGNSTVYTAAFTKTTTSLTQVTNYTTPNETPQTIDVSTPGQDIQLAISKNLTTNAATLTVRNAADCASLRIIAAGNKSDVENRTNESDIITVTNTNATRIFSGKKLKAYKKKVFMAVECDGAWLSTTKAFNGKLFAGKPVKNITAYLAHLKKKIKAK